MGCKKIFKLIKIIAALSAIFSALRLTRAPSIMEELLLAFPRLMAEVFPG